MRVALIACGYADGLPRACSNRGRVLIRGQRAPLVGTVSMDMAMADVSHLPEVEIGDEVVVLGPSGRGRDLSRRIRRIRRHHPSRAAGATRQSRAARLPARRANPSMRARRWPCDDLRFDCDEASRCASST